MNINKQLLQKKKKESLVILITPKMTQYVPNKLFIRQRKGKKKFYVLYNKKK